MAQPTITYSLDWGNNTAQKLSGKTFTKPDGTVVDCNTVSVTFSSSVSFSKFYATAVKEGNNYGFYHDATGAAAYDILYDIGLGWPISGSGDPCTVTPTGVKIYELTSRSGGVNFNFTINANNHFTSGEGLYRIGLYVQNSSDGTWNYEYFFITSQDENFELSTRDLLQVPVITV